MRHAESLTKTTATNSEEPAMNVMTASIATNTAPFTTGNLPIADGHKVEPSVVRSALARWTENILNKAEVIPFHEIGGL
jgi:hypothetical protein